MKRIIEFDLNNKNRKLRIVSKDDCIDFSTIPFFFKIYFDEELFHNVNARQAVQYQDTKTAFEVEIPKNAKKAKIVIDSNSTDNLTKIGYGFSEE